MKFLVYSISGILLLSSCKQEPMAISDSSFNSSESEPGLEETIIAKNINDEMKLSNFLSWYRENKTLNKINNVAEFDYHLNYLPAEQMALFELRREDYDFDKFQKTCENYKNMIYFNFRIELKNGKVELLKYNLQSLVQYDQRIKYMSFEMQKDIYIEQNSQAIYPDLYQFERIFNVAPYSTVMLAFDSKKLNKAEELTFIYNDKLFEKGIIKFHFKKGQLTDLPKVTGL